MIKIFKYFLGMDSRNAASRSPVARLIGPDNASSPRVASDGPHSNLDALQ